MLGSPAFTTPVDHFPRQSESGWDFIGNAWEITASLWTGGESMTCCGKPTRTGGTQYAKRGGSFACWPGYCDRARSSGRQPVALHDTTSHNGFRVVR
jgi:formylglycine-generating enzyme required for sulfatase activity